MELEDIVLNETSQALKENITCPHLIEKDKKVDLTEVERVTMITIG